MRSRIASSLLVAFVGVLMTAPATPVTASATHTAAGDRLAQGPSCAGPDSVLRSGVDRTKTVGRDKEVGRSSARVVAPAVAPTRSPDAPDSVRPPSRYHAPSAALIDSLRHGGYVLVFRHGKTDWGQRDAAVVDFADRAAQRNLSEIGRRESAEIGRALAGLRIPIGTVLSSPMWRCRDTATLAFGKADTTIDLFQRGKESREARLRMLGTRPTDGTNTVIVTHQDVLLPIMALQRDELGEGEALLVKPLGSGSFEILAQATPADWIRFLSSRKP